MGLRGEILVELVKEVLGPRNGPYEILYENPLDEYITGVLQPVAARPSAAPDTDVDSLGGGGLSGEEDLEEPEIAPPVFSPAMDPRSRPSIMGLSFYVRTCEGLPRMRVCATWALYSEEQCNGRRGWRRQPRAWVGEIARPGVFWLGSAGPAPEDQAEVSLHVRYDRDKHGAFLVLIHLVNRLAPHMPGRVTARDCIFQPQIRVVCQAGTWLEPVRIAPGTHDEDARLDFLYRKRPVMARGHLCSAMWREIDPERPAHGDGRQQPEGPPFTWVDGLLLPQEERVLFSPPDVRTEFVPVYAIRAPEWDLDLGAGPAPVLDAGKLAESADPDRLRSYLQPLVDGYELWIADQERIARQVAEADRKIAEGLLEGCRETLRRMRAGLDVLVRDGDARLAFAFANRAMELQASWAGRPGLRWRPFQMGFILVNLEPLVNEDSADRAICDLLWIPTGGGKTEAYLFLAAFTMALRRRRALRRSAGDRSGAGTSVLSRYTLRLLTVQQFRRALAVVTACEFLRVQGLAEGKPAGWRPSGWPEQDDFLWGSARFSIGLWVGGNLTPNRLETMWVRTARGSRKPLRGALDILRGERGDGEPAQVLECPACGSVLAVPEKGLPVGEHYLHLCIRMPGRDDAESWVREIVLDQAPGPEHGWRVANVSTVRLPAGTHLVVSVELVAGRVLKAQELEAWWRDGPGRHLELACFRVSRPGYFPRKRRMLRASSAEFRVFDFEVWCPNPACALGERTIWCEGVPADDWPVYVGGRHRGRGEARKLHVPGTGHELQLPDGLAFRRVCEPWQAGSNHSDLFLACRVPIPAYTVDDQVYAQIPSMVIATVDKFARLPFEPRSGALFGNVTAYHPWTGYMRDQGTRVQAPALCVRVIPPDPPDLILQDELHLIEGPLGSLVGLYETAVELLCGGDGGRTVKYVAATATVREAESQVQALFGRRLRMFPPPGLDIGDRFFVRAVAEPHPLEEEPPGQLYVGVCAPGRGPLTPIYRIWALLLHLGYARMADPGIEFFWTVTGYFNAVRELAGAQALYRQDVVARLARLSERYSTARRPIADDRVVELSSRTDSGILPALLDRLARWDPASPLEAPDALFATSMFGTGVDIPRLSLMVVHGQPKTTSAYIQATGRVGRQRGSLVVVFLRASRPRDLSHYEFFCGYHRQLHRHVEPVTLMPFSPGALDIGCGPVMLSILRNRRNSRHRWHDEATARDIVSRLRESEVAALPEILEQRALLQPDLRRPAAMSTLAFARSELERWAAIAKAHANLQYVEYAIETPPSLPVVLGDPPHVAAGLPVVFDNAPQSLREVEDVVSLAL